MRSAELQPPLPGDTTPPKPGAYERILTGEVYLLHISVWLLYMINLNIPVKLEKHSSVYSGLTLVILMSCSDGAFVL